MAITGKNTPPSRAGKESTPSEKKPRSSMFGKRREIFVRELRRNEYFTRLRNTPRKEREEIAKTLIDPGLFGNIPEKGESLKMQSLEKELRRPGTSSYSKIKEIGKKIRGKYGRHKTRILADIIHEKYLGEKK
jgi:hypothetical protein